ncbi:MAG TPA: GntR family transcriptional regulator [Hyphomicrobiaceae bacterium]|nr:GntR family transcriptional regulator [Hyphomicrobiaceae bacterium]
MDEFEAEDIAAPDTDSTSPSLARRQPLYVQIAATLAAQIAQGEHPVGSLLPTEAELQQQFHVSRYVVRQAIQHLRSMGLVTARKGVGTRVEAREAAARFLLTMHSVGDIRQYATGMRLEIQEVDETVLRGSKAALIGARPGRRFLRIIGIRRRDRDNKPVSHAEIFIDDAFSEVKSQIPTVGTAIWEVIERQSGETLAEVEQQIDAVTLDAEHAHLLEVAEGTPALRVIRRYYVTGRRLVELSINLHPANRFSYNMRIKRDGGTAAPANRKPRRRGK